MDTIWAPWRVKYLVKLGKKNQSCVFCRILRQKKDKKNYIFLRSQYAFSVLNIFPYNIGHSLVVPYRHVSDLSKLTREEKLDLLRLLETTKAIIDKSLKSEGYNIGINLGRVAGAGFPGHIHIHLVPRWAGDMNFMPVVSHTKVISQSLGALWEKLNRCARAKK